MASEIHQLVTNVSWKVTTILRVRKYFSVRECIDLYKSKVLSYIEYRTAALYHSCDTHLNRLDAVQRRFLNELDITEEDAIVQFNLAPLSVRRDVAMLGLIHRAVLGHGPEQLKQFFHRSPEGPRTCKSRLAARRHNKQLVDPRNCAFLEITRRSALGLVAVYNLLPQVAVDITSVKAFQSQLQNIVKRELHLQNPEWQQLLSPRVPIYRHPLIYIDV